MPPIAGPASPVADPRVLAERERLARIFESCFRRLQARDRINLVMWQEGHSDAEIGERLDITANNAAQRRYQALPRLRACLEEKMPEYLRND